MGKKKDKKLSTYPRHIIINKKIGQARQATVVVRLEQQGLDFAVLKCDPMPVQPLKLRTDKSVIYAHQGYIYTPPGKSSRRYVVEFPRPAPAAEPFNLFLQRAAHGKIRFDGFRIEARKK